MGPVARVKVPMEPTGPIGGIQLVLRGGASVGVVSGHGAALAAALAQTTRSNDKPNNKPNNKTAELDP